MGDVDGASLGVAEGYNEGTIVGVSVGASVGRVDGLSVGAPVGDVVGDVLGEALGDGVGEYRKYTFAQDVPSLSSFQTLQQPSEYCKLKISLLETWKFTVKSAQINSMSERPSPSILYQPILQ